MRRQSVDFMVDEEMDQINTSEKKVDGLEQKVSEPILAQEPVEGEKVGKVEEPIKIGENTEQVQSASQEQDKP